VASAPTVPPARDPLDAARLRAAGLRATGPRLATMAVLARGGHLSVEAIAAEVRARLGTVSIQAVYDVLRALGDAGLVRRIQPAGSPALFEARVGDNHHHLICRACGAVVDVDCAVGEAPCLEPGHDAGYLVDEADVTFWGLCPACRADV
jgi:Fur family ferric uptake transcriptional regulator